jgi:hypothetical protein
MGPLAPFVKTNPSSARTTSCRDAVNARRFPGDATNA